MKREVIHSSFLTSDCSLNEAFNPSLVICDIGTTNIKMRYCDSNGNTVGSTSFRNPQFVFGADVISRISAGGSGNFKALTKVLHNEIEKNTHGASQVVVCGNPAMIHFMAGVDPSPLGIYPFECVFKNTKHIKEESGLSFNSILLPSASAYIGSDALCGIYSALKTRAGESTILIADIGTNGEISLIKGDEIYSVSTAAGPAIEGASIECGVAGGDGVIYGIDENGKPLYDGEKATGINGAGLISLISYLLKNNILSCDGEMDENIYYLTDSVYVSRRDISELMLAKSAIKTAIELLLLETQTNYSEINTFILTGGVLKDLKTANSFFDVDIVPKALNKKAVFIPELAIMGANTAVSLNEISALEELASKTKVLYISDHKDFEEKFIVNTFFEE